MCSDPRGSGVYPSDPDPRVQDPPKKVGHRGLLYGLNAKAESSDHGGAILVAIPPDLSGRVGNLDLVVRPAETESVGWPVEILHLPVS